MIRGSKHRPETMAKMRGLKRSSEACAKMSVSAKTRPPITEVTRAKLSVAGMGRKHSPEVRAKIAASHAGENNYRWRGGRYYDSYGYVLAQSPTHPHANGNGYVFEHRLVMEAHLGRTLSPTEVVHHINGIPDDNRRENLERFDSQSDHVRWHRM